MNNMKNESEAKQIRSNTQLEKKMQQLKKFSLPFIIENSAIKSTENFKISDQIVYQSKISLIAAFKQKTRLFDIASEVTEKLEEIEGGYWLCNIHPVEVENGLIKSEYRGFTLNFSKDSIDY